MRTIQEHNRLSVVIPTLDAAAELPATLATLANSAVVREIIIADGGSRDATVQIARDAGGRVIVASRGRGPQLAAGAAAATSTWLLFLHADCRPGSGWEDAVAAYVTAPDAAARAGYFALVLDDAGPAARRLERLVAWRCRILALPYGDQGLLIFRALYEKIGGFAPIPLMEDVDLVRRLGRNRLAALPATACASARRYRQGGYIRRPLRNLACLSLYFAGLPPRHIARLYG
jgi:rSAM/selenodomain-associated transferase 2